MEVFVVVLVVLVCIGTGIKRVLFPEGMLSKIIPCMIAVALGAVFINLLFPNHIFITVAKICMLVIILLIVVNVIRHFLDI